MSGGERSRQPSAARCPARSNDDRVEVPTGRRAGSDGATSLRRVGVALADARARRPIGIPRGIEPSELEPPAATGRSMIEVALVHDVLLRDAIEPSRPAPGPACRATSVPSAREARSRRTAATALVAVGEQRHARGARPRPWRRADEHAARWHDGVVQRGRRRRCRPRRRSPARTLGGSRDHAAWPRQSKPTGNRGAVAIVEQPRSSAFSPGAACSAADLLRSASSSALRARRSRPWRRAESSNQPPGVVERPRDAARRRSRTARATRAPIPGRRGSDPSRDSRK